MLIGEEAREFATPEEAEFVYLAVRAGANREHLLRMERALEELASSRTRNRKLQREIREHLRRRLVLPPPELAQARLV